MTPNLKNFKLCYVKNLTAYFTSNKLEDQTGEGWESWMDESYSPDTPSVYLSTDGMGTPILPREYWNEDLTPKYQILKVPFGLPSGWNPSDLDWEMLSAHSLVKDDYTVLNINLEKVLPWITFKNIVDSSKSLKIYAGTTFEEFKSLLESINAPVYIPSKGIEFAINPPLQIPNAKLHK